MAGHKGGHASRGTVLANKSKIESYTPWDDVGAGPRGVVGLGLLAAMSALAGGAAVAWWHRKTLAKLQNPINSPEIQKSEFSNFDLHDKESDDF